MGDRERHFDSANQFIAALRRSDPYWLPSENWQSPWIFRGQREAEWPLIPSAWREDRKRESFYSQMASYNIEAAARSIIEQHSEVGINERHMENATQYVVQTKYEFLAARAFADLVDDLGLPIPGGPLPAKVSYDTFRWMTDESPFHPTVALAQHHGIRTRLLDWTHNPLIAAFFAAENAALNAGGSIAVWAIDRRELLDSGCREFTVQRSQFGYLHAQEGLFTYSVGADFDFLRRGTWPDFKDLLPESATRKFTLAKSQVPELKRLLWAERISKAHLMPSLDNVTAALQSLWSDVGRLQAQISP